MGLRGPAQEARLGELSDHLRQLEITIHGRGPAHPVCRNHPQASGTRFRTLRIYEEGTIDDPANTVDAALAMGRLVAQNIGETRPALGIGVPGLLPGRYRVSLFDTVGGAVIRSLNFPLRGQARPDGAGGRRHRPRNRLHKEVNAA